MDNDYKCPKCKNVLVDRIEGTNPPVFKCPMCEKTYLRRTPIGNPPEHIGYGQYGATDKELDEKYQAKIEEAEDYAEDIRSRVVVYRYDEAVAMFKAFPGKQSDLIEALQKAGIWEKFWNIGKDRGVTIHSKAYNPPKDICRICDFKTDDQPKMLRHIEKHWNEGDIQREQHGDLGSFIDDLYEEYTYSGNPRKKHLTTLSGREIPVPNKSVDKWLVEQGIAEAKHRQDDWNMSMFKNLNSKRLQTADRDALNIYLFGVEEVRFTDNPGGKRNYEAKVESPWWMTKWEEIRFVGEMGKPTFEVELLDEYGELIYGTLTDIGKERANPPSDKCPKCGKTTVAPEDYGDYDDACEWACHCPTKNVPSSNWIRLGDNVKKVIEIEYEPAILKEAIERAITELFGAGMVSTTPYDFEGINGLEIIVPVDILPKDGKERVTKLKEIDKVVQKHIDLLMPKVYVFEP